MKNLFLLAFSTILTFGISQNREIAFEHGDWASVLAKAKKENKLIFVDAFTTWCGPCKWMAKNVFTNDTVADYFNQTFVNYKFDMEKGEGIEFAKKYQVSCYPNLVFIDKDGNLVHRGAGGMPPQMFITFAKNSLTTDKNFIAQKATYENGSLNSTNIFEYIDLLRSTCLDPRAQVEKYIATVKEEDLQQRANWYLIRDFSNNLDSREIKYFLKNSKSYETKFGKDSVERKIVQLGNAYFTPFYASASFDKAAFEKSKKEFIELKWPQSERILFDTELNLAKRYDKNKYFELASADFLKYNKDNSGALNSMAWSFYEKVSDKKQLEAAAKMAQRACELSSNYAYLDTYAAVLYKSGANKEAEKVALQAIEKAKEGKMSAEEYRETTELLDKIKTNLK